MAANTTPIFILSPIVATATIAAANTARDGSGSLVDLFTAPTDGGKINTIKFQSAQATAAASSGMVVRVFVTDTAGANPRLLVESVLTSATASNTVIGAFTSIDFVNGVTVNGTTVTNNNFYGGIALDTGQIVKVSQSVYAGVQDQNHVSAIGGYYS